MTWSWRKWLQRTFAINKSKTAKSPRHSRGRMARLDLEQLENRVLPALVITPTFAANIVGDPQAATIEATINTAIQSLESQFSDNVVLNVTFQEMSTGLGESQWNYDTVTYTQYRNALISHATSAADCLGDCHASCGPQQSGERQYAHQPPGCQRGGLGA